MICEFRKAYYVVRNFCQELKLSSVRRVDV